MEDKTTTDDLLTEPVPNTFDKWQKLINGLDLSDDSSSPDEPSTDRPPRSKNKPRPTATADDVPEKPTEQFINRVVKETSELLKTVPEPFIEPANVPYQQEYFDKVIPRGTFISDFVNLARHTESPPLFMTWGALWTLSSALDRSAWIKWYPKPLWPNLYVMFVAPAGLCKKSLPIDFGSALLEASEKYRRTTVDQFMHSYRFLTSKGSPEGLYMMLKPETKGFLQGPDIITAERTSKVFVSVGELATFLGKQQYNTGLVNLLTDLYDCKEKDAEVTRGRGVEPLKGIYVTFAGAITPTGLEESIPPEALSGGLMSRCVAVYQDMTRKIYARPGQIEGYPELEDIAKKLAWIANTAKGEYDFSPEAEEAFTAWYTTWKTEIMTGQRVIRDDENRKDIMIRKVAMLLRVAEYNPGNIVSLKNFEDAKKIMDFTSNRAGRVIEGLKATDFSKKLLSIEDFIKTRKSITRKDLLRRFSRGLRSDELNYVLSQLAQGGAIKIIPPSGIETVSPSTNGNEIYTYTGDMGNE